MNVVALFLLAASGAAPTPAATAAPLVPVFARFHGTPSLDDAEAGRLLLGELNCTSCHAVDAALGEHLSPKRAPILSGVGDRVRPEFIRALLADPQHAKPGTTMPDVLTGLSEQDKKHQVEALTHFLASTSTEPLRDRYVDKDAAKRGEQIFHDVGCAACHGSRKKGVEPLAFAVPLGDPAAKYTVTSLAHFLVDPLKVRPSGRMPKLRLTDDEARDAASYFLQNVPGDPNVRYEYYEGRWNDLPDFSITEPVATGTSTGFDITVGKKMDRVAFRFHGYLHLDADVNNEFRLTSDDGARLFIDDVLLIDHDGIHPATEKQVRSILKKGVHKVRVEYFNDRADAVLKVEMFRPKKPPQNLASLLTLTPEPAQEDPDAFRLNPALVEAGRKLFSSAGCASCHELKLGDEKLAAKSHAKPLVELRADRGCTAASTSEKAPNFALSAVQRTSLAAAQAWVADVAKQKKLSPPTAVARTKHMLAAFNCYACHRRDGVGGVDMTPGQDLNDDGVPDVDPQAERMSALFQTAVPEMGDEGRLPPKLDGVGAKLTDKYLKTLLTNGADDRPYMKTVMPDFGGTNVGRFAALFQELDPPHDVTLPKFTDPEYRVKADGRLLVGTKGFSCVKCHNFNTKKAEGIPGIDLTILTKRVRPEWFVAYVRDPQQFRPGTRMPTVFPGGKSPLPQVLGGDVDRQIASIYLYLNDGVKAAVPVGVGGEPIELVADTEAVIYRNFLAGVGPRAIGVGYPEKANLAFDADQLGPSIIWHGAFIDASVHWGGRGGGSQPPLGDDVVHLTPGPSVARLKNAEQPWPEVKTIIDQNALGGRFRGYRLDAARRPTFLYDVDGATVADEFRAQKTDKQPTFLRTVRLSAESGSTTDGLWFRAAAAKNIKPLDDGTYQIDDLWRVRICAGAAKPIVRSSREGQELIVPVTFTDGRAVVEQEFLW